MGKGWKHGAAKGAGIGGPAKGGGDKPAVAFTRDSPTLVADVHTRNSDPETAELRGQRLRQSLRDRARAFAELEAANAPTPLQVMTAAMARKWQDIAVLEDALADAQAAEDEKKIETLTTQLQIANDRAVDAASRAAPYMHAKLASTVLTGDKEKPVGITFVVET